MRIGMILDNEYLIDARVPNEAKYLAGHGHEVYVLCPNYGGYLLSEISDKVHIVRFNMSKRKKDWLFGIVNTIDIYDKIWSKEIDRFIKQYQINVLHVHDLYMIKAAYIANRKYNLPITLDLHENYPAAVMGYTWANSFPRKILAQPALWKKKEHPYLKYADSIVVLSEAFRQTLCSEYPDLKKKQFVIYPNIPDVNWFLSLPINNHILEKKTPSFILFYFGVIGIRRGMVTCFEALKKLIADIPQIRLLMIGPVDKSDQKIFNQYYESLKQHIIYYPWKEVSDLPSYIASSDICLAPFINSPQHDSGISNKVFQYMLFGSPVLLSDSIPHKMLVDETGCGETFVDTDVDDLAAKVIRLYKHPDIRRIMGQNGKKAVMEKYNLETAGKELLKLYE